MSRVCFWLFRIVISASIHADLRMIPHESALFSKSCKSTSLWGRTMSGHCEGFCTSGAVICPLLVAPERFSGAYGLAQSYWFLCVFMGYPSETSMKCGRNSTTEKSGNCTTPLASCAVSSAPFPHNKSSLLWGAPPSLLTYSPVSSLLYSYACLARLKPRFF